MSSSVQLSVLDLVTRWNGVSANEAIQQSVDMARHVEQLGFARYWFAEHHNTPWQASSAPELLIAHVAAQTSTLRIGSGGVMLPNHSPLKVVENFRTLEAMHPGRIDLGIGRAPGTDGRTALALRRSRTALVVDDFGAQMAELLAFFNGDFPADHVFHSVAATPLVDTRPDLWILGSSEVGAQVAAQLGLGFAFAHHIAPEYAVPMLRAYRANFRPSALRSVPHAILAAAVFLSDDAEAARDVAALGELLWTRLSRGDIGSAPPTLAAARAYRATNGDNLAAGRFAGRSISGTAEDVTGQLHDLLEASAADELMVLSLVPDQALRRRSHELLAHAFSASPVALVGQGL